MRTKLAVRPSRISYIEHGLIGRKCQAVGFVEVLGHRCDLSRLGHDPIDPVSILFGLVTVAEIFGTQKSVIRVGEPDGSVRLDHYVVRRRQSSLSVMSRHHGE